jgi:hypothetical protein
MTDLIAIVGTQIRNFQNRSTTKGVSGNQTPSGIQISFNPREQWVLRIYVLRVLTSKKSEKFSRSYEFCVIFVANSDYCPKH